jgi:hypothetical protein
MANRSKRSRWEGLGAELRLLSLQGCCAIGGILGLWQGVLAAPKQAGSAHVVPALAEVLGPVAWRVGTGVLAGALIAWLLCAAIPALRAAAIRD